MTEWRVRALTGGLVIVALVLAGWALPAVAHDRQDDVRRIAVVSAFAPEMTVLRGELDSARVHSINGVEFVAGALEGQNVVLFLSGISVVNAAMTVQRAGAEAPETRFWFPVDEALLAHVRTVVADVVLDRCRADGTCLQRTPKVVIGGPGVSGGAFIDNAAFRDYTFKTFGARVLDMESAAVAHVAYANNVSFIAVRSLSDLAGGGEGENEIEVFLGLAASNSAMVVKALLRAMPE